MIKSVILACIIGISGVFAQNFNEFKNIADRSYLYRMQINESYVYLKKVMKKDYLLSAKDIKLISTELKKRIDLYNESQNLLTKLRPYLYTENKSEDDLLKSFMFLGTFFVSTDAFYYSLDQFSRNYKIRRILEEENLSNGQESNVFAKSLKKLFSRKMRSDIINALDIFLSKKDLPFENEKITKTIKYIKNSYSFKNRVELGYDQSVIAYKNFFKNKLKAIKSTKIYNLRQKTLNLLYKGSKIFGNTAGIFQSRNGKLYRDKRFISLTNSTLRPLDTLLEKTPFRLTDKFIPGFWGHAAIYIGNKSQLEQMGIWDHPQVSKYHKNILEGRTIVEALRSGVKINSLTSFSDIDDFAILRLKEKLSLKEKQEYILSVLSHIGKDYDFAFNVETPSKIVCSELHYLTYLNVNFNIEYIFMQPTISVDSVAKQGTIGRDFNIISLYTNGKKQVNRVQSSFDQLLGNINSKFISVEDQYKLYLD